MVIFLYGENTYDSKINLENNISFFRKKYPLLINYEFDFSSEYKWSEVESSIKTLPLFQEKKIIVLKNFFASKNSNNLVGLMDDYNVYDSKDTLMIIWEPLAKKKLEDAESVLKKVKLQHNHDNLGPMEVEEWVKTKFRKNGLTIEGNAATRLILYVGNDFWRLHNEIEKICSYKESGVVRGDDINRLVTPNIEVDIFKLIDSMLAQDKSRAFLMFEKYLENSSPRARMQLLSMIAYQFRNLLIIKDLMQRAVPVSSISKKADIHPYVVKKSIKILKDFELEQLKSAHDKIVALDISLKSTSINSLLLFDMFLLTV